MGSSRGQSQQRMAAKGRRRSSSGGKPSNESPSNKRQGSAGATPAVASSPETRRAQPSSEAAARQKSLQAIKARQGITPPAPVPSTKSGAPQEQPTTAQQQQPQQQPPKPTKERQQREELEEDTLSEEGARLLERPAYQSASDMEEETERTSHAKGKSKKRKHRKHEHHREKKVDKELLVRILSQAIGGKSRGRSVRRDSSSSSSSSSSNGSGSASGRSRSRSPPTPKIRKRKDPEAEKLRRNFNAAVRTKVKEWIQNEDVDLNKTWRNQGASLSEDAQGWYRKAPKRFGVHESVLALAVQTAYKSQ